MHKICEKILNRPSEGPVLTISMLDLGWVGTYIVTQIFHQSEHVWILNLKSQIKFSPEANQQIRNSQTIRIFFNTSVHFQCEAFEKSTKMYKTGNKIKWKRDANNFFLHFYCILKTPSHNIFEYKHVKQVRHLIWLLSGISSLASLALHGARFREWNRSKTVFSWFSPTPPKLLAF